MKIEAIGGRRERKAEDSQRVCGRLAILQCNSALLIIRPWLARTGKHTDKFCESAKEGRKRNWLVLEAQQAVGAGEKRAKSDMM